MAGARPGWLPANFSWIDLPIFGEEERPKEPRHDRGIVPGLPGLYFVGLFFLYALSSSLLMGVGRDAKRIVDHIASRTGLSRAQRITKDLSAPTPYGAEV